MSSKFFGNKHDKKGGEKQGKLKSKDNNKAVRNVGIKKSGRGR